jgi:purine-binding chemotaxis protein CheW
MNIEHDNKDIQVVMFKLHDEDFCIDISKITEIIKIPKYTKIPSLKEYIEGIINFRGIIIAIIDLNVKLGFPKKEDTSETRIIVLEINNKEAIGLKVDSVSEVIKIKSSNIKTPPIIINELISDSFIKGVVVINESLLIILEADKLLNNQDKACVSDIVKSVSNEEEEINLE